MKGAPLRQVQSEGRARSVRSWLARRRPRWATTRARTPGPPCPIRRGRRVAFVPDRNHGTMAPTSSTARSTRSAAVDSTGSTTKQGIRLRSGTLTPGPRSPACHSPREEAGGVAANQRQSCTCPVAGTWSVTRSPERPTCYEPCVEQLVNGRAQPAPGRGRPGRSQSRTAQIYMIGGCADANCTASTGRRVSYGPRWFPTVWGHPRGLPHTRTSWGGRGGGHRHEGVLALGGTSGRCDVPGRIRVRPPDRTPRTGRSADMPFDPLGIGRSGAAHNGHASRLRWCHQWLPARWTNQGWSRYDPEQQTAGQRCRTRNSLGTAAAGSCGVLQDRAESSGGFQPDTPESERPYRT